MSNIWDELNSFGRQMFYQNRRKYFLWRNKMDTTRTVYSDKTEEEMKEILGVTDIQWNGLKRWEESDEYKRLMYILYADNFDTDLIEIYDAMKEQALKGNNSAVKTILELQEEITNRLKKSEKIELDEEEEEDDNKLDLKLNI